MDSTIFETKFAQYKENQFDGQKGGEHWKSLVGNYCVARHHMMTHILEWAENRGSNPVTKDDVEKLRPWMNEDPHVINHLLWGFLNINLVGAAKDIFSNTEQSNGLEVWRKIHALNGASAERRQEEHYQKIHHPKPAANAGDVANALENWDTSQRLHRQCGGLPLREVELRSIILRLLPHDIKMHIIQVSQSILTYENLKNYVKEHARVISVHMTKSTPAHLAETEDFGESITDEFLERTENLTASDQLLELGFAPGTEAYAALATKLAARKNVWRAGKGRKFEKGGTKGGGKGKVDSGGGKGAGKGGFAAPKSKDGRPICVNCNEIGHDQTSCTKPRVEAKDRLCLRCDKKGHTARQCKSGLPLKEIGAEEGEDQYTLSLEEDTTMN